MYSADEAPVGNVINRAQHPGGMKMKKVLIAYSSRTKKTEAMANYIAEGLRMTACQADVKSIAELENEKAIAGYDAYIFGCPTYHKDMTGGMKQFLFKAQQANLAGKPGGAFGSHTHSGESAPMIYEDDAACFQDEDDRSWSPESDRDNRCQRRGPASLPGVWKSTWRNAWLSCKSDFFLPPPRQSRLFLSAGAP